MIQLRITMVIPTPKGNLFGLNNRSNVIRRLLRRSSIRNSILSSRRKLTLITLQRNNTFNRNSSFSNRLLRIRALHTRRLRNGNKVIRYHLFMLRQSVFLSFHLLVTNARRLTPKGSHILFPMKNSVHLMTIRCLPYIRASNLRNSLHTNTFATIRPSNLRVRPSTCVCFLFDL